MSSDMIDHTYVVGEFQEKPNGKATPQERKSPPLSTVLPNRDDFVTLPKEAYFKPEYVELEWEKLWTRVWLFAGRESDAANPGEWFRFDFGRESFIVSRANDGELKAFYNVCQHRGNALVEDDFGKSNVFVCPYHSWGFDRSGRCIRVTDRELFKEAALAGNLDLPQVRVATFRGFVFITMNPDAPQFVDFLGEPGELMSGYKIEGMEVRNEIFLELACNWKTLLDAFSENYHVHITHGAVLPAVEDKFGQMDFYPNGHIRRLVPAGNASSRLKSEHVYEIQRAMLQAAGIHPDTFTGGAQDVRRAIQVAKRAMPEPHASVFADLSDNQLTDNWAFNICPNMHWNFHAEGMMLISCNPHPSDPERCIMHAMLLGTKGVAYDLFLKPETDLMPNGRPKRVRVTHEDPRAREVVGDILYEDIRSMHGVQRGIKSSGFDRIRLSEHEQPIMYQYAELQKYLNA